MSALNNLIALGTTAAQWTNAFLDATPETGLLIVWGTLLILAGQSGRARAAEAADAAAPLLEPVGAQGAQTARG